MTARLSPSPIAPSFALCLLIGVAYSSAHAGGFRDAIRQGLSSDGMSTASFGACVIDVASGEVKGAYNADLALIPASTIKAATTAVALQELGKDYRFETRLEVDGPIEAGTLKGNLIVDGGGDPTLGWGDETSLLAKWADLVKQAGITSIAGRVIGDATSFHGEPCAGSWPVDSVGNYYGAWADGLNYNRNSYRATFDPGRVGAPARLTSFFPEVPGVRVLNQMRTGAAGSGDNGYLFTMPYGITIRASGTVPASKSFAIKGAVPDPALFLAHNFGKALQKAGISQGEEPTTMRLLYREGRTVGVSTTLLHTEYSPSLTAIARRTNFSSVNIYAEALLKQSGKAHSNKPSIAGGAAAIKAYIAKAGVSTSGLNIEDGCGLSRLNLITPRQLAALMRQARQSSVGDTFQSTLPIAAKSGTLRFFGRGSSLAGRVSGKSGTMTRTKGYAGFLRANNGRLYAFAALSNGHAASNSAARRVIERALIAAQGL